MCGFHWRRSHWWEDIWDSILEQYQQDKSCAQMRWQRGEAAQGPIKCGSLIIIHQIAVFAAFPDLLFADKKFTPTSNSTTYCLDLQSVMQFLFIISRQRVCTGLLRKSIILSLNRVAWYVFMVFVCDRKQVWIRYNFVVMSKFYNQFLQRYPLCTKTLTSGTLFSLGDALTQLIFEKKEFNWKRNIDFFAMGFAYIAPALHLWYCKLLPRVQAAIFPTASKTVKVLGSMVFDQLLFAPVLLTGFFPFNQVVTDRDFGSFGKGVEVCKQKLWETLQSNWKIWPIATTINFWFMPVQYQVLFANFVGLFWNMVLSFITWK